MMVTVAHTVQKTNEQEASEEQLYRVFCVWEYVCHYEVCQKRNSYGVCDKIRQNDGSILLDYMTMEVLK